MIEAIRAVSSPQTKAPAPMRTSMRKRKLLSRTWLPRKPRCSAGANGALQAFGGNRVLAAHVDEALVGADGVAGDGHAFEHAVRIGFHQRAVHVGARVAFVAVGDDVLALAGRLAHQVPLQAGGEAGAAAATQAALADLLADILRRHFFQSTRPGRCSRRVPCSLRGVPD